MKSTVYLFVFGDFRGFWVLDLYFWGDVRLLFSVILRNITEKENAPWSSLLTVLLLSHSFLPSFPKSGKSILPKYVFSHYIRQGKVYSRNNCSIHHRQFILYAARTQMLLPWMALRPWPYKLQHELWKWQD